MRFGLLNDIRKLDKARYPLMIERFMALAFEADAGLPKPYPKPALQIDPAARAAALARFGLTLDRPVLALCPGAEFGESKRWPTSHFAEVAEARIRAGWQVWLFGSKNDREVGEEIRGLLIPGLREEAFNLAGETSLAEAIDLLSCADAAVSNDSGLMHVAAALGARWWRCTARPRPVSPRRCPTRWKWCAWGWNAARASTVPVASATTTACANCTPRWSTRRWTACCRGRSVSSDAVSGFQPMHAILRAASRRARPAAGERR